MRAIVCADDFGRSSERNKAIDYAMKKGLIRSAGLIMGSDHTDEAIEYALKGGYLRNIHCHFNVSRGSKREEHFTPVSAKFKSNKKLCKKGEFADIRKLDNPLYIIHRKEILSEIEEQFLLFKEKTGNKANYNHVDFHLYINARLPVSYAYSTFIRAYDIQTARYYGEHHRHSIHGNLRRQLSVLFVDSPPTIKSCNADYFRSMRQQFDGDEVVEIYCHPDYKDGVIIDNSKSIFGHEVLPLEQSLLGINQDGIEMISWADL